MSVEDPGMLADRVRSGAVWGALNVLTSRLLQFGTTVVVARLVAPEHFGALAVALTVQLIAVNASELGATAVLARGQRDPDAIAPTVFTIALSTSAVLTGLMVWSAPWVAKTMGDPSAVPVIQVMSLTVMLSGLSSVPSAMIWRNFLQKRRMAADLLNILVTTAVVIPLALNGGEAMALAWSRVAGQAAATAVLLLATPRRYRPGLSVAELPALLRTGMPLALANVVVFATLNLDYLVIGRELGSVQLGLYLLAFNLASLPSNVFTQIVRTVAVPAFGRLHASGGLREAVPGAVALITLITFPVAALLAGLSGPLVEGVYGSTWAGAAPALVGLGVFAAGRTVTELLADLSLGIGRTGSLFWVQVVWLVSLLPTMILGVKWWGIAGAGIAHAVVAWLVVVPVYLLVVRHAMGLRIRALLIAAGPATFGAVACGVAAWTVSDQVSDPFVGLTLGSLAGAGSYLVVASRWLAPLLGVLRGGDLSALGPRRAVTASVELPAGRREATIA